MTVRILTGDCLDVLPTLAAESVHCCVTSPPYFGLRDYEMDGQIGLETTPAEYIDRLVRVFRLVRDALRPDGTLWLNLGDSYAGGGCGARDAARWPKQSRNDHMATHAKNATGLKPKDLIGIPWRVALALQDDGWYLRQDIIWHKLNPMPESVRDRCTKAHEYLFLLSKSERYFFDHEAISEPSNCPEGGANNAPYVVSGERGGANANIGGSLHKIGARQTRRKRSVWSVASQPYDQAHFATFPPALIEPCILAGCAAGGMVLDPFGGAGTTGLVANRLGRDATLIELNPDFVRMIDSRLRKDLAPVEANHVVPAAPGPLFAASAAP